MLTNIRTTRIEWCDCDPAGIIFYPRYFEIFDTCTTALIERALGMNKIDYLKAYDFAGQPVVETRARFRQPTRFGDDVAIETKLVECGRSSFKIEHRLKHAGDFVNFVQRRANEKETIAADLRKEPFEIGLANQQVSLQDTVV